MPVWTWVVIVVAVVGLVWLLLWAFRWKDSSWSDEKAKGAKFGWSKRGSGNF